MPSVFEQRSERVLDAVREGLSLREAAQRAGVAVATVRDWLRKGRSDPAGRYGVFAARVDEAKALAQPSAEPMCEEEFLGHLARAVRGGSVQAMKLWLELRREPPDEEADGEDPLTAFDELAQRRAGR